MPRGTRRPRVGVTGCNIFSLARLHGLSLVATADDIKCSAIAIFGFTQYSEEFVKWYSDFIGRRYAKTPQVAEKSIRAFPRLDYGRFSAIMVSPLEKTEVKPDIVMIYMNAAQVNQVLLGLFKRSDQGMTFDFTVGEPVSTCSYGIVKAYNTQEPQLVIPGTGDRQHGMTQDDELAFVIPVEKLSEVVTGIQESRQAIGTRYPVPMDVEVPPEIDEYHQGLARFYPGDYLGRFSRSR